MTLDEAQVLLQSAKPADCKADQKLSQEEYANLIFSQTECLDVDLKVLKPTRMENFPPSNASTRSYQMTEMSEFPLPKTIYDDDYVVLDQKQVPQNIIESIE